MAAQSALDPAPANSREDEEFGNVSTEPQVSATGLVAGSRQAFVIVASQRTGSTLLLRSLDSAPKIYCAGEIFHPGRRVYHSEHQLPPRYLRQGFVAKLIPPSLQLQRIKEHLRQFYSRAGSGATAVGFKLMVSQSVRFPGVLPFLAKSGVIRFFLYRRSTFDAALSYYKAKASGIFHLNGDGRSVEPVTVVGDVKEFGALFESCRLDRLRIWEMQRTYGGRLLAYEDMETAWAGFIATIGIDIGIPDLEVPKALSKIGAIGGGIRLANETFLRTKFHDEAED